MHVPSLSCALGFSCVPVADASTTSSLTSLTASHPPHAQATMSTPPPPPRSAPASALTRRHDSPFFHPLRKPGCTKDDATSHLLWGCHPAGKGEECEAACNTGRWWCEAACNTGRWWCERRATGRGWVRRWARPEEWCPIRQGMRARHGAQRGV